MSVGVGRSGVEGGDRLAERFPEKKRREVQNLAESYARLVIDEGWPMMREGRISARAETTSDELRRSILAFESRTDVAVAGGKGGLYFPSCVAS